MAPIERATLFTVGNEEDGKKILETYKTMKSDAKKVCYAVPSTPPFFSA